MRILFILLLINFQVVAQGIEVVGEGSKEYYPDMMELKIEISAGRKGFDNSMKRLNRKIDRVKKELEKLAIQKNEWRLGDFAVKNAIAKKKRKYVDSGYVVRQYVVIMIPYEKERMIKVMGHFSKMSLKHKYFVSFFFSDSYKTNIKEELYQMALKDARSQISLTEKEMGIKSRSIEAINNIEPARFPEVREATIYLEDQKLEISKMPGFNDIQRKEVKLSHSVKVRASL